MFQLEGNPCICMFLISLDIQTGGFKILLYTSIIQYPAEFFRSAKKNPEVKRKKWKTLSQRNSDRSCISNHLFLPEERLSLERRVASCCSDP